MYLHEAYAVFKETRQEDEEMSSLSAFCKLRPKNVLLLNDTPEDTCKCQTHENLFLKLDAMGCTYDSSFWSFWGEVLCDTSENSNCWLSKCDDYREGKKFSPKKQIDSITIYKQWKTILVPANHKGNQNDKKLQIISEQVTAGEVYEDFQQSLQDVTAHVNLKRTQACAFQDDIKDANTRVIQIYYTMDYQCQQQREVQSAVWARVSVNIFPCAVYHNDQTKTFLICTNYKGKDKFSNDTFLEYLYENELQHDDKVMKEVI